MKTKTNKQSAYYKQLTSWKNSLTLAETCQKDEIILQDALNVFILMPPILIIVVATKQ